MTQKKHEKTFVEGNMLSVSAILSNIIDKKDLQTYIALRIELLTEDMHKTIKRVEPPQRREPIHRQFEGRILELKNLREIIEQNSLKRRSISTWRILHPKKTTEEIPN